MRLPGQEGTSLSEPIVLMLPYPPSANRYWRTYRGRVVVSTEARAYKAQVARIWAASGHGKLSGRLRVEIQLYPKRPLDWQRRQRQQGALWADNVRRLDSGNCNKIIHDALQGLAYDDDRWIWDERTVIMEPAPEAAARVLLWQISG